jgi:hypothetical protein
MSNTTFHPTMLALLVPLLVLGATRCSHPTSPASDPPDGAADASAISARAAVEGARRASDAEVQAFLQNDPAALARLWSNDFVVTNPFNALVNKQQVLALVTSGALAFSAYTRTTDYAHAYGDIVIIAGRETVHWAGTLPLAGKTSNLRYTAVWQQRGDGWAEIARHANIIPPAAAPAP